MFGIIRFVLFSVLLLVLAGVVYFRKSVGEPYVISKQKLEEISNSAAARKLKDTSDKIFNKELNLDEK